MKPTDICFLTIAEASRLIASGELSPVEVTNAHLERIERKDGELNSFITLMRDEALASARRAEAEIRSGNYLGPLHGVPIGLKDLYYTKGVRTTVGSKIMGDFVPDFDAAVVERLRNAGAVIVGKLQMHEFAMGATSVNPHHGPAHNPWDVERVTGGSSGGSGAAVAASLCMGALGSDTGGSVRIPAALCGIVGLKPTFGRVSKYGVFPLSWSADTVGPMTRTVRDTAIMLSAMAGHDPRDPSSSDRAAEDYADALERDARGIRIGVPNEYFYDMIDPEVEEAVSQSGRVFEGLGCTVDEVSIPIIEHSVGISSPIMMVEAAEVHLDNLRHRADDISDGVRRRFEAGALIPAIEYVKAQRARALFNREIAKVFERFDILLSPTVPIPAPKIGEADLAVGERTEPVLGLLPRLTRPFNLCGVPTISVPCGFTSSGLPIGLQLAGRAFDEATVLRVAHAFEQATDWHTRRPPV